MPQKRSYSNNKKVQKRSRFCYSPRGQLKASHRILLVKKFSILIWTSTKTRFVQRIMQIASGVEKLKRAQYDVFLRTLKSVPTRVKIVLEKKGGNCGYSLFFTRKKNLQLPFLRYSGECIYLETTQNVISHDT